MENKVISHHYSPLRYPGGKSCIYPFVSELFYENNLIGINYAEPYAGGAGVALKLLFEEFVDEVYINDFDKSIYYFWKTIIDHCDDFCEWINKVNVSIYNWKKYKRIHEDINGQTPFEIAKATFFLNRTNISGVIKGGIIGGLEQKGKYKIDARFNKTDLIARIQRIATQKKRINVSNLDGIEFIKKINKRNSSFLIYLDPPYYLKGADLYMNFYKQNDHRKLAKYVAKIQKDWIVSYDNNDFIIQLYQSENKVSYKLSQCASNRIGDEILIFSDSISFEESIRKLNSPILIN